MVGGFRRFQRFDEADRAELRAVRRLSAFLGGIHQAQFDRINVERQRDLVDDALNRVLRHRCARCAVSRNLGAVGDHVMADHLDIVDVIRCVGRHAALAHGRTRQRAGLIHHLGETRDHAAVVLDADLDLDVRARCRAAGAEHVFPAHRHLDRAARFLCQAQRERLKVDNRLAAKTTTDFGTGDLDLRGFPAKQAGAVGTDDPMALGRNPKFGLVVLVDDRETGMWLDVGLVDRRGIE